MSLLSEDWALEARLELVPGIGDGVLSGMSNAGSASGSSSGISSRSAISRFRGA